MKRKLSLVYEELDSSSIRLFGFFKGGDRSDSSSGFSTFNDNPFDDTAVSFIGFLVVYLVLLRTVSSGMGKKMILRG